MEMATLSLQNSISQLRNLTFVLIMLNSSIAIGFEGNTTNANDVSVHVGSEYYPPLEFISKDGLPDGFITEIRRAIAAQNNENLKIELQKWDDAILEAQISNNASIALIPTVERAKLYQFTPPFHYVAHAIFASPSGPKFESIDQLENMRIAVVKGAYAASRLDAYPSNAQIIFASNELECLQLVAQQQADACIEGILSSTALAKTYELNLVMTSPAFWPRAYVFAVKKGNDELLERINNGLAQIVIDGTYSSIYAKWEEQLDWEPASLWEQMKWFLWLFAFSVLTTLLALLWSRTLKRKVAQKTAALEQSLSKSRSLQVDLEYSVIHDPATDLLNRAGFIQAIDEVVKQKKGSRPNNLYLLAVQMVNLNTIITALGYEAGWQTIKTFASKLKTLEGSKIAHLGVGTFVLSIEAEQDLAKCIKFLEQPLYDNLTSFEPELVISSVAFDEVNTETEDSVSKELMRRAIASLAYARQKRLNYVPYDKSVEPERIHARLLNDFNKSGCSQFVLYYQPQIDLQSGKVSGVEALLRWVHPELGLIPPSRFVPLFEESGAITKVTRWVVSEAARFIQKYNKELGSLSVSVNITSQDLIDPEFMDFVRQQSKSIPHNKMIFEITESGIVEDGQLGAKAMTELNTLGIVCAIDDYGTGYSTLSYLYDLSVDEIKIDRSFISKIAKNERALKIVESTILLCHQLDLIVVAEGVESSCELTLLQDLQCDRIQGYFFSKPLKEKDLLAYIQSYCISPNRTRDINR
ncbi:EAL domain-containing protein [Pseudidiomarina sp.]|uniref:EAL domain-containing protein n=1 Tax=Pseudidiomarina sp. TaxID=2081707 RepID=UPI003A9823FE